MQTSAFVYPVLVVAFVIYLPTNRVAAQIIPDVSASYSLLKTDLSIAEPIFVRFTVENRSTDKMVLDLGLNGYGNFRLKLVRPDGRTETAPKPQMLELGRSGAVSLDGLGSLDKLL